MKIAIAIVALGIFVAGCGEPPMDKESSMEGQMKGVLQNGPPTSKGAPSKAEPGKPDGK